jgi:hypothetical protein
VVGWGAGPPSSVNGTTGTASAIAAGQWHSCAIQSGTGQVVCWGRNDAGEATPPSSVNGTTGTASAIAAGGVHSLAIQAQAPDADSDGVPDTSDNCPHAANADQLDTGGLGTGSPPDGIGDACQCGDVTGDGRVTSADAVVLTRALLVPPAAVMNQPSLCDVGGSSGCSAADAVIIRRALLTSPTATIGPVCAPAHL